MTGHSGKETNKKSNNRFIWEIAAVFLVLFVAAITVGKQP